jgi:hypothetical protein
MALDGTYSGLLAAIADFSARSDLTASLPDFVVLAERDMARRLRVRLSVQTVTLTVTNATATLPSDFGSPLSLVNSQGWPIEQRAPDALNEQKAWDSGDSQVPTDYAIVNNQLRFWPSSTADTVVLTYMQRIPALAANPSGNWVSLNHPDAYLYGSLTQLALYTQDAESAGRWAQLYDNAIQGILDESNKTFGARLAPQPTRSQTI